MSSRFDAVFERSLRDPEGFWGEAAEAVSWCRRWDRVLDDTRAPFYRWFAGAEINTCYNAVDLHVETGRGAQPALLYDSPVTGRKARLTYAELRDATAHCAGALARLGVGRGDRVVIYMPMVPEAVVAMLACARLGAVHSVVFGGFASRELAGRIDDCAPKVVLSASCGVEPGRIVEYKPLLDGALELAPRLGLCRRIVDLVATGGTLRANGLVEVETIAEISSRLAVNRAALKTRPDEIGRWIDRFQDAARAG